MSNAEKKSEAPSERSELISHLMIGRALTPVEFVAVDSLKSLVRCCATGEFKHEECSVRVAEGPRWEFGYQPDLFTEEQGEPWDESLATRVTLVGEDRFLDQTEYWLMRWVTEGRRREKENPRVTLERDGWEAERSGRALTVTFSKEAQA